MHRSTFDELAFSAASDAILDRAFQVQAEASEEGFDWPDADGVLDKIAEELGEIRDALAANDEAHAQKELGDLLLAAAHLGQFLHIHPAEALAGALDRFEDRYGEVKLRLAEAGKLPGACSLEELDAIWAAVKINKLRPDEEGA